eukprot:g1145.t1
MSTFDFEKNFLRYVTENFDHVETNKNATEIAKKVQQLQIHRNVKKLDSYLPDLIQSPADAKRLFDYSEEGNISSLVEHNSFGRPLEKFELRDLQMSFRLEAKVRQSTEKKESSIIPEPEMVEEEEEETTSETSSPLSDSSYTMTEEDGTLGEAGLSSRELKKVEELKPLLKSVLQKLINLKSPIPWGGFANPFMVRITPENCTFLGVPEYFSACPVAMDFNTIKKVLEGNGYMTVEYFKEHVMLVINNAKSYNRVGEPMYIFAQDTEKEFNKLLRDVVTKLSESKARSRKGKETESFLSSDSDAYNEGDDDDDSKSRKKRDRNVLKKFLKEVLEKLKSMPGPSWQGFDNPFMVRITRENCLQLGVGDYFDYCKHPMDFSTMTTLLNSNAYRRIEKFKEHVLLIIENAKKYNAGVESPMHMFANETARVFEEEFGLVYSALALCKEGRQKARLAKKIKRWKKEKQNRKRKKEKEKKKKKKAKLLKKKKKQKKGKKKRKIDEVVHSKFELRRKLSQILSTLKAMVGPSWANQSNPFCVKVTPQNCAELGVPDYFKECPKAMDLTTMTELLQSGHYDTAEKFESDLNLIVRNAYKFNRPQDPVYIFATSIERQFNEMLLNLALKSSSPNAKKRRK